MEIKYSVGMICKHRMEYFNWKRNPIPLAILSLLSLDKTLWGSQPDQYLALTHPRPGLNSKWHRQRRNNVRS